MSISPSRSGERLNENETEEEKQLRLEKLLQTTYSEKEVPKKELLQKLVTDFKVDLIDKVLKEKKVNIEERDEAGRTPLMKSIIYGNLKIAKLLLKHGASVHTNHIYGWKAIHYCANQKETVITIEIMKDLIARGADINAQVMGGLSALHFASINSAVEICTILLMKGIKKNLKSVKGKTASDVSDSKELRVLIKQFDLELELQKLRDKRKNKKRMGRKKKMKKSVKKKKKIVKVTPVEKVVVVEKGKEKDVKKEVKKPLPSPTIELQAPDKGNKPGNVEKVT